jgi:hypothetical protein
MTAEVLEKIEEFLAGRIDREELQAVADRHEVTDLDAEIAWLRDSQVAIEAAGLRDQLRETLPAAPRANVRRLRPRRLLLAIAASALVLVAAALWLWRDDRPGGGLYADYEFVDPGLPVLMSQSDQYALYDALTYYGEGNYPVAIEKLRALQAAGAGSDTLQYYLGASLLYAGEPAAARTALDPVRTAPTSAFAKRAQWLWVLAALREGDRSLAAPVLEAIVADPQHPFRAEAQRLQTQWTQ